MKKYKHLFFDLDGTIWDLRKNTREAMLGLFQVHQEKLDQIDFDTFFKRYHHHNDKVWALYREGKIEKESLRYVRFERTFCDTGVKSDPNFLKLFADEFMEKCPRLPHTLPGAHDVLKYCKSKYELHIITNGFIEVQSHKMNAAALYPYFTKMIHSEDCGVKKPHPEIFQYAIDKSGASVEESLMIGDDWEADILGARNFGIDQAFLTTTDEMMNEFNNAQGHDPIRHNYKPTHTIQSLGGLLNFL